MEWAKVHGHLIITLKYHPGLNYYKLEEHDCIACLCMVLNYTGCEGPRPVPASFIKAWLAKFGTEEIKCCAQNPDLKPTEKLWDVFEHYLQLRPQAEWA